MKTKSELIAEMKEEIKNAGTKYISENGDPIVEKSLMQICIEAPIWTEDDERKFQAFQTEKRAIENKYTALVLSIK